MSLTAVDGRTIRREKSRQCIISAVTQLLDAGEIEPTAEQVAKAAGVTMRTVFRHFDDMESLYREIILDMQSQLDVLRVEYDPDTDWRVQFDQLILRRTGIFERLMTRTRASQALRHRSKVMDEDAQQNATRMRHTLEKFLPDSLVADTMAFAAVEVLLSSEVWNRLRRDQNLSVERATEVIQHGVAAILKDS
ncbi:MAG: TetR/AcrR family transcriptional regulator [Pseudomonadota bacterium]